MSTSKSDSAYHHGDLKAALVEAARALVEESGPAKVSLREAARRAGVSHNAPYRHFASREALLAAVAREGFAEFAEALAAAGRAAGRAGGRDAALIAQGIAYVRFALDNPGLHRLMFSNAIDRGAFPELAAAAGAAFEVLRGEIAGSADGGWRRTGGAAEGNTAGRGDGFAALRAWAMVHGLAQLLLDGELPRRSERWSSPEALVQAVLTGDI